MLKILICCDSFKGYFSSLEAGGLIALGVKKACEKAGIRPHINVLPLADGGEGSLKALDPFNKLKKEYIPSLNESSEPVNCPVLFKYKNSPAPARAFFQASHTCGFKKGAATFSNGQQIFRPVIMGSTFGTGLVLKELVLKNTGHITLFAGGTSTCDGGMGAAKALGLEFYNSRGMLLDPCGKNMLNVCTVKYAHQAMGFIKTLKNCALDFACDVNNPLSGPMGAASVYAPQKGASPDEVILLDRGLKNLESVISRFKDSLRLNKQGPEKSPAKSAAKGLASAIDEDTDAGINTETELESGMGMDADTGFEPGMGMGAAGGLALGLSAFFNINFVSGAQVIINKELIPFIKEADLIITGEGRLDSQSFYKKAQHTLLKTIKKLDKNKPVISINGQVEPNLNRPGKDTKGENIFFDSIHACLRCSKNGEHENNNLQKAGQNFAKQNLAEQRPAKQTLAKQSPAKQRLVRTAFQGLNAFFRKQNITKKD